MATAPGANRGHDTHQLFRTLVPPKIKTCGTCGKSASYAFSTCPRCGTPLSTGIVKPLRR